MGLLNALKGMFLFSFNVLEGAPPLNPQQKRGLALGAIYSAEAHLPINALAVEGDRESTRSVIAEAWDVTGPSDVEGAYEYLETSGHRTLYALVAPKVELLLTTEDQYNDLELARAHEREITEQAPHSGLSIETAHHYYHCWRAAAQLGRLDALDKPLPTSIVAWDAARMVNLTRLMLLPEYISEAQAWAAIERATDLCRQAYYSSWQDFGDAFVVGRAFWMAGISNGSGDSEIEVFQRACRRLRDIEGSPWRDIPYRYGV